MNQDDASLHTSSDILIHIRSDEIFSSKKPRRNFGVYQLPPERQNNPQKITKKPNRLTPSRRRELVSEMELGKSGFWDSDGKMDLFPKRSSFLSDCCHTHFSNADIAAAADFPVYKRERRLD